MEIPNFRTGYNHDFGPRNDIDFGDEPSLTIQSAKDECDINLIIDRANRGMLPNNLNNNPPVYADVSNLLDYQTALNLVIQAQDRFDSLPATVRDRFSNDPAKLLEFVNNDSNRAEAESLGLLEPKPKEAPPGASASSAPPGGGAAASASETAPPPAPKP